MLKKFFTRFNLLFLILIIITGFIFRVYKIDSNYYFSGELGKELVFIREYVINSKIPLVGMATSHTWLYYGPIYYWIMIPIFYIFNGNPFVLFWAAICVSVLALIVNYVVVEKIADKYLAIVSTLVQSLSPLLIWQTRLSKLHVFFWVLMPILIYLLYEVWNGNKKYLLIAGLTFGVLFSFHFSQIPIIGVIVLLFYIKRSIYKLRHWLIFTLGVLIPNITLLWQDKNLLLWLPYRIVNSIEKNPMGTINSLIDYFGKNIFWDNKYYVVGFTLILVIFIHYTYSNRNKFFNEFLPFYIISSTGIMLIANVLHGSPPIHYFLPIFTTVPILLAIYLLKLKYWMILVVFVVAINCFSLSRDPLFYKDYRGTVSGTDIVDFESQNNAVKFIISNSKGSEFNISRIGPYDYFPDQYSQNYKYLILWKGGRLTDKSTNVYTIIENEYGINVQK